METDEEECKKERNDGEKRENERNKKERERMKEIKRRERGKEKERREGWLSYVCKGTTLDPCPPCNSHDHICTPLIHDTVL